MILHDLQQLHENLIHPLAANMIYSKKQTTNNLPSNISLIDGWPKVANTPGLPFTIVWTFEMVSTHLVQLKVVWCHSVEEV